MQYTFILLQHEPHIHIHIHNTPVHMPVPCVGLGTDVQTIPVKGIMERGHHSCTAIHTYTVHVYSSYCTDSQRLLAPKLKEETAENVLAVWVRIINHTVTSESMANTVTTGPKWFVQLPLGQNGLYSYHWAKMANTVTIGPKWLIQLPLGQNG